MTSDRGGKTPPRLIFLSQLFDPEPTFKGLGFARALADRGFDIEVVTGFPNYPGGKVYDGYRIRPVLRERMDGVDVTRLAIYPSHDRRALHRLLCYASFMLSSTVYLLFGMRRADIVYVYYPSLTAGLAAIIARIFRRTPVVIDIQDMWPDSLGATGMVKSGLFLKLVEWLCALVYRAVDHIVVLSPGFRDLLISRGVPADRITLVYNWAEETERPEPKPGLADGSFSVLFAGNMGAAQGLETVLEAAAILSDRDDIRFDFLGSGLAVDDLKAEVARRGLRNVRFMPRVPLAEVQEKLAEADCLLVHLKPDPLFSITIPSKTQAYLYAGKPVLMAVEGDAARLVEEAGAGLAVQPGNARDLAGKVLQLHAMQPEDLAAMGRRGQVFYEERLSFSRGLSDFETLFRKHARKRRRGSA